MNLSYHTPYSNASPSKESRNCLTNSNVFVPAVCTQLKYQNYETK